MQGKMMSEQSAPEPVYVGIDVCKERLDVYVHPTGQRLSVANSRDGLKRLKQALAGIDVALVVMEATAKYHRLAQRTLVQAGLLVAVVNPLRARLFAEAAGALAKTDRIDARMLWRSWARRSTRRPGRRRRWRWRRCRSWCAPEAPRHGT